MMQASALASTNRELKAPLLSSATTTSSDVETGRGSYFSDSNHDDDELGISTAKKAAMELSLPLRKSRNYFLRFYRRYERYVSFIYYASYILIAVLITMYNLDDDKADRKIYVSCYISLCIYPE